MEYIITFGIGCFKLVKELQKFEKVTQKELQRVATVLEAEL